MSTVPVRSPLLFYKRRGVPASPRTCSVRNLVSVQPLAGLFGLRRRAQRSRDFSLSARLRFSRLIPLLALATGCAGTPATGQQSVVLPLHVSITLLVCAALLVGFFGGVTAGMKQATTFLRLADTAAGQYHREQIGKILNASSTVHDLVEDIIQQTHARIRALRAQLRDLKERKP